MTNGSLMKVETIAEIIINAPLVCLQTILMQYHTLFFSKIRKDVTKFVVCFSQISELANQLI